MNEETDTPHQSRGPSLASLDGADAPISLIEAMLHLNQLPDQALERLSELVATRLEPLPEDQRDAKLSRFCRANELETVQVGAAVRGLTSLLRAAAAQNLKPVGLEQDLSALGVVPAAKSRALELYENLVGNLREEIARASIAAHGPVMIGAEWRIDTVGSTSRGKQLDLSVALVTIHYQNGSDTGRLTLQMLPEAVHGLRDLCDHLLSK